MEYNLKKAFDFIEKEEKNMIDLWGDICKIESPSSNFENVNTCIDTLKKRMDSFGMVTKIHNFSQGPSSISAYFETASKEKEMILLGHLDTVHSIGKFGKEIITIDEKNDLIHGPGVLDCKGGVIVALFVARTLHFIGYNKMIKLAFSGDEEVIHSYTNGEGKKFFLEEIKGFKACIDCETGFIDNRVVIGRKGAATFTIDITGKGAHSGNEPEKGISAIKEAALKTLEIEKNNDFNNIHYNVGVINGGTTANSIPEKCSITINVRFREINDINLIKRFLKKVTNTSFIPGTKAVLNEISFAEPMEQLEKNNKLFNILKESAQQLNLGIPYPHFAGGGSDAAYGTMLGIPTLCGLGVKGFDNHTITERAIISSLKERTKLLVTTILNLPENF